MNIRQGQGYVIRTESNSFADGKGVGYSVYISGCPPNCVGCYNEASQRFRYGEKYADEILAEILDDRGRNYISGLGLLGGRLFCNLDITLNFIKAFRTRLGNTETIWVWTGFLYEYLTNDYTECRGLLSRIGVLVDDLLIQHLFEPGLSYKDSLDQRTIDVWQSLSYARMVEYIVG